MGCDIHGTIERKVGDRWVMLKPLTYGEGHSRDRNYQRFAQLAGVRGDGPEPRGLPPDISESTRLHVDDWGPDGHSHSWMPLTEAAEIFRDTEYEGAPVSDYAKTYPCDHYFEISDDTRHQYRLVFWFDN